MLHRALGPAMMAAVAAIGCSSASAPSDDAAGWDGDARPDAGPDAPACPGLPDVTAPDGPPMGCGTECGCSEVYCENQVIPVEPGEVVFGSYEFEDLTGCYDGFSPDGEPMAVLHLELAQMYFTACGCLAYFEGWYRGAIEVWSADGTVPPLERRRLAALLPFGGGTVGSLDWPDDPSFELYLSPCATGIGCHWYGHELPDFPVDLGGAILVDGADLSVGFVRR